MLRDDSFTDEPISHYFPQPEPAQSSQSHSFDDIFGSAPSSPTTTTATLTHANTEPSDIPRLRSEHSTAGYRDGLGVGKAQTMQAGFDEGYSLGATIGLRVGAVLGTLEGFCAAVCKGGDEVEIKRAKELVNSARNELKTESVFGREYWGSDGIWTFEVAGEEGDREVTFADVADAHPLLNKWEGAVKDEAIRWGVDLKVFERGEVRRLNEDVEG